MGFGGFLFILMFFAQTTFAQPLPRMTFCLNAAHEVQINAFAAKTKYILEEKDLKAKLPAGCRSLNYFISEKSDFGFRVGTEIGGEAWAIDENLNVVRLARGMTKAPSANQKAANVLPVEIPKSKRRMANVPIAPKKENPGKRVPMAVLAWDQIAPLSDTPMAIEIPTFQAILNTPQPLKGPVANKEIPVEEKMERCFSKKQFATKFCKTYFTELEQECSKAGEKLSGHCVNLNRRITTVRLDNCDGSDEEWGMCELRKEQLKKHCENPLRQNGGDCRSLAKYLVRFPPQPDPVPQAIAQAGPEREPASSIPASLQKVEPTALDFIHKITTLSGNLEKVLRLRPVSFQYKKGSTRDVGFVAEEVEQISEMYVSYSDKNVLQGIRYPQMTTLLAGGLQELYGICQANKESHKDTLKRVFVLQQENTELKKQLRKHELDLLKIKTKLGLE